MSESAETVSLEVPTQPIQVPPPAPIPTPQEFSGKPGDLMADLALLDAQQKAQQNPVEVSKPVETQPEKTATAPVTEVPDKFKTPEGGIDVAKVEKSTLAAEEALKQYLTKEKELRQKQNEVAALRQGTPYQTPTQPVQQPATPLTAFELTVAQDLINEAAAVGYQMPQGQAIAQARVLVKMNEAKAAQEQSLTEHLRVKLEDQDRVRELETIAKEDAWVFSPEGVKTLYEIRQSKPWLNQSPTPWQAAYESYLAESIRKQRLSGTVTPNPTVQTAKAPPTPVSAAPRVSVQPVGPNIESMSKDQLNAHVAAMTPEQEKAFWASRGLKFR
jgi:hypothetical protein